MFVYKLSNESLKDPGKGSKHMYITYLIAVKSGKSMAVIMKSNITYSLGRANTIYKLFRSDKIKKG